ncbi:MAG: ABC transporter ATP-binding protein/permease [Treponemataceae bacterium]|nr:ABC transporter ATP-binding protein/permease [Treponemataceae bacterium]
MAGHGTQIRLDGRAPGAGPGERMAGRVSAQKPQDRRKTLRRLFAYIGRSRATFFALLACMVVVTVLEALSSFLQQKALDTIALRGGRLTVDLPSCRAFLLLLSLSFMFVIAFTLMQERLAAKLSQDTIALMRGDLFRKIARLPIAYTDSHRHGDLMSRMTNDTDTISLAVSQSVAALGSAVLTLACSLAMMFSYSVRITLVALVTIPVIMGASTLLARFMRTYYARQQRLLGELNGVVEENVTGYRTIVAYGRESSRVERFAAVSAELKRTAVVAKVLGSVVGPITNFLGNFQYVLIAVLGGWLMLTGRAALTVGTIQALLLYSKKLSHPVNMIADQYASILSALAGAERVFAVLDEPDETDAGTDSLTQDVRGEIVFDRVSFGYTTERPVLKDISLRVKPGQKIALVGATGSGKTTVANLLMRFYEPDGGRILLDGTDIARVPKADVRRAISIVLQDTVLFQDTIRANIAFGKDGVTDAELDAAARTALCASFIQKLPDGYDTWLSERGANLSEGQRQLLAIARAVVARAPVLILDEATSNVDTRTEMHIQTALANLMRGRTSIIIAHRLSTIRDADLIVVLADGAIAESGTHEELLARRGEYYALYRRQFAGIAT